MKCPHTAVDGNSRHIVVIIAMYQLLGSGRGQQKPQEWVLHAKP